MSTDLTTANPTDLFLEPTAFEQAFRVAKMFAASSLIPQHLRGKEVDCMVALGLAKELGDSPLHVMQAIYFIGGKAGFSASYIISRANRSGLFRGPLRWDVMGQGDSLEVRCYAVSAIDGETCEVVVTMAMAKAEGWTKNPKYRSIPVQMLRYRAATWLVRLYCPEVMHGMHTREELDDVRASAAPAPRRRLTLEALQDVAIEEAPAEAIEPVTVDAEPAR